MSVRGRGDGVSANGDGVATRMMSLATSCLSRPWRDDVVFCRLASPVAGRLPARDVSRRGASPPLRESYGVSPWRLGFRRDGVSRRRDTQILGGFTAEIIIAAVEGALTMDAEATTNFPGAGATSADIVQQLVAQLAALGERPAAAPRRPPRLNA
jgi:hypothetical protein